MDKVAIITYQAPNIWSSCKKIIDNLTLFYSHKLQGAQIEHLQIGSSAYDNLHICREIANSDYDLLIFIDQRLNPLRIINPLFETTYFAKKKKIIYHFFGDPLVHSKKISTISNKLKDHKFNLVLASEVNLRLVESLVEEMKGSPLSVFSSKPSPNFLFNDSIRKSMRLKLGFTKDDKVLIYHGRISPEKNVDVVIKAFKEAHLKDSDLKLIILGPTDNLNPYLASPFGFHKLLIHEMVGKHEAIKLIPSKSSVEPYLFASDAFISLSTMILDDYGMSAAEAIVSGLPCTLTKWAGYRAFIKFDPTITYINVDNDISNLKIDFEKIVESILEMKHSKNRKTISSSTYNNFISFEKNYNIQYGSINLKVMSENLYCNRLTSILSDDQLTRNYSKVWL